MRSQLLLFAALFLVGWLGARSFSSPTARGAGDNHSGNRPEPPPLSALSIEGSRGHQTGGRPDSQLVDIIENYERLGKLRFGEWFHQQIDSMSFSQMEQLGSNICAMERREVYEFADARDLLFETMLERDPLLAARWILGEADWERQKMGGNDLDVDLEYDASRALGVISKTDPALAAEMLASLKNQEALEGVLASSQEFTTFENFNKVMELAAGTDFLGIALAQALLELREQDPESTARMIESLDDPEVKKLALEIDAPPDPAQQRERTPAEQFRSRLATDPEGALAELRTAPNNHEKVAALKMVSSQLGRTHAEASAEIIAALPPTNSYWEVVMNFANNWAQHDPDGAVKWGAALERPLFQSHHFLAWFRDDRAAATAWVGGLPDSKIRKSATDAAVLKLARSDPPAARELARSLAPDRLEELEPKIRKNE